MHPKICLYDNNAQESKKKGNKHFKILMYNLKERLKPGAQEI